MIVMEGSLGVPVAAILLLAGALCSGHARPVRETANAQAIIDLYNPPEVPDKILNQAIRSAASILWTTGVMTIWRPRPGPDACSTDIRRRCALETPEADLRLRIVRSVAPGHPAEMLGYTLPFARTGINATVFFELVKRVAQVEMDNGTVLGLAIVQEIGHVFLRSTKHSPTGIMKSPWTKNDIQHAAARLGEFTVSERSSIHERCTGVQAELYRSRR